MNVAVLTSSMKDFIARIGTFFYLMAAGLFALFIASDPRAHPEPDTLSKYELLCLSVLLVSVGFLFRRTAAPPEAADRFRMIRKIQDRHEAAKKERARPQQGKK